MDSIQLKSVSSVKNLKKEVRTEIVELRRKGKNISVIANKSTLLELVPSKYALLDHAAGDLILKADTLTIIMKKDENPGIFAFCDNHGIINKCPSNSTSNSNAVISRSPFALKSVSVRRDELRASPGDEILDHVAVMPIKIKQYQRGTLTFDTKPNVEKAELNPYLTSKLDPVDFSKERKSPPPTAKRPSYDEISLERPSPTVTTLLPRSRNIGSLSLKSSLLSFFNPRLSNPSYWAPPKWFSSSTGQQQQHQHQLEFDLSPGVPKNVTFDGMRNMGNTCYMSAVMQAIISLKSFQNEIQCSTWTNIIESTDIMLTMDAEEIDHNSDIIADSDIGRAKNSCVSAMMQLAMQVNRGTGSTISLDDLKSTIDAKSEHFIGYNQHDAHEFLIELIDSIHEELMIRLHLFLYRDHSTVADDIKKCYELLPTRRFLYCDIQPHLTCCKCGYARNSAIETYNSLSIDIHSEDDSPDHSLTYFLNRYFEHEIRELQCEKCYQEDVEALEQAKLTKTIKTLPNIFVIHLKRFEYDINTYNISKIHSDVDIPLELNIRPYCSEDVNVIPTDSPISTQQLLKAHLETLKSQSLNESDQFDPFSDQNDSPSYKARANKRQRISGEFTPLNSLQSLSNGKGHHHVDKKFEYNLCAIIRHKGYSPASGHYICDKLVMEGDNRIWKRCDDSKVTIMKENEILQEKNTPYLLFYSRSKN